MLTYENITSTVYALTPEGAEIASRGSHEARFWQAVPKRGEGEPLTVPKLKASHDDAFPARYKLTLAAIALQELLGDETAKIGQSRAFKNKWIAKEGAGFVK